MGMFDDIVFPLFAAAAEAIEGMLVAAPEAEAWFKILVL